MNHPFLLSTTYRRLLAVKRQSFTVASLYSQLNMNKKAFQILTCSPNIKCFLSGELPGQYYSFLSDVQCRSRHCPVCQLFRTFKMRSHLLNSIPQDISAIFVTLTQRNCAFADLSFEIDKINYAFRLFWKSRFNPFLGAFRSFEVTVETNRFGYFHPHLHLLVHVPDDYFSYYKERGYDAYWLSAQWRQFLNLDYNPIVHISGVRSHKALLEVSKYITKPASYRMDAAPIILYHLHHQLHGRRLFSAFGTFKDILGDLSAIDNAESIDRFTRFGQRPDFSISWHDNCWRVAA